MSTPETAGASTVTLDTAAAVLVQNSTQGVEFNDAVVYLKGFSATSPHMYKKLLDILRIYKDGDLTIQDLYRRVAGLFTGCPDLMEEFQQFLPSTCQKGLGSSQHFNSSTSLFHGSPLGLDMMPTEARESPAALFGRPPMASGSHDGGRIGMTFASLSVISDPTSLSTYHTALTSQSHVIPTEHVHLPFIPDSPGSALLLPQAVQLRGLSAWDDELTIEIRSQLERLGHLRLDPRRIDFKKEREFKLGDGGQSSVYQGTLNWIHSGSPPPLDVAVKVLRCDEVNGALTKSLLKEISAWSELRHHHILPLIGFCLDGDGSSPLIVTVYQWRGGILQHIQATRAPLVERLHMIMQTLAAVAYLHWQNICHSDIKSHNFLIGHGGNVLLCDFGLARSIDSSEGYTTTGDILGTTRWSSPELLMEATRNFPGDVWSWGCLFMEVIKLPTLMPYHGVPNIAVTSKIIVEKSRRWPYLPLDLYEPMDVRAVVEPCWEWEPEHRPTIFTCCKNVFRLLSLCTGNNFGVPNRVVQMVEEALDEYTLHGYPCEGDCRDIKKNILGSSTRKPGSLQHHFSRLPTS